MFWQVVLKRIEAGEQEGWWGCDLAADTKLPFIPAGPGLNTARAVIGLFNDLLSTLMMGIAYFYFYTSPKNQEIMLRHATAVWNGSGKEGNGQLSTQSGVLEGTQYSFNTRFADGKGTNPEELVAAAHAGCFTMKLSFILNEGGYTADRLETRCDVTFENGSVTKSHLTVKGKVPNIDEQKWKEAVQKAEKECPISKLLNTEISSEATLG